VIVYLSDITFRRAGDGAGDLIGYVSVTVDQRRHLSALEIRRALDGTPCLGTTAGNQAKLLRAVRARERRLFQLQLFGELAKRGIDLLATPTTGAEGGAP
jgi:hypothetical protein